MRKTIAALCVAAAIVGACSATPGASASATTATSMPDPTSSVTPTPRPTPSPTLDTSAYDQCKALLGSLIDSLSDLDASLTVGISFDDYGPEVTALLREYNRLDLGSVGVDDYACLEKVGSPAERAVNKHLEAHSGWKVCFDNYTTEARYDTCFEKRVQPLWTDANDAYREAKNGLDELRP